MQLIPYSSKSFSNPSHLNEQSLNKPYCESFSTEALPKLSKDSVLFGNGKSWHYSNTHQSRGFWYGWIPSRPAASAPRNYYSVRPTESFPPPPKYRFYTEPGEYIPYPLSADPRVTSSKHRSHTSGHKRPSHHHSNEQTGTGTNPFEGNGIGDDHVHDVPSSSRRDTRRPSKDHHQGKHDSSRKTRKEENYFFASSCTEQQIKNMKALMRPGSGISYTIKRNGAGEIVDVISS